jgi:uncharacterized protein YggE
MDHKEHKMVEAVEKKGSRRRFVAGLVALAMGLTTVIPVAASQGAGDGLSAGTKEIAQGITVKGDGEAAAPADSAVLQFIVRVNSSPDGTPTKDGAGFPSNVADEQMAALVAAAQSKGIDDKSVEYLIVADDAFYTTFGPGVGVLAVQIDKAELKHRIKIVDAVKDAAKDNGLVFDQIGAQYIVDDCASLDLAALADAKESAEAQATRIAQAMGVSLGAMIAVETQPSYGYQSGPQNDQCAEPPTMETALEVYFPPFNRDSEAEREVYESLLVTYEIE